MYTMFTIIGTLQSFLYEERGVSQFPTARIEISTGEKFHACDASGEVATLMNQIFGLAPVGTAIKVAGKLRFRAFTNRDGAESVMTLLEVLTGGPVVISTASEARFSLVGQVGDVMTRPTKDGGTFSMPMLNMIAADRTGLVANARVELSFLRDDKTAASWGEHAGQLAQVSGRLDAFITGAGRSIARFYTNKVEFAPWQPWIAGGLSDPDTMAVDGLAGVIGSADFGEGALL